MRLPMSCGLLLLLGAAGSAWSQSLLPDIVVPAPGNAAELELNRWYALGGPSTASVRVDGQTSEQAVQPSVAQPFPSSQVSLAPAGIGKNADALVVQGPARLSTFASAQLGTLDDSYAGAIANGSLFYSVFLAQSAPVELVIRVTGTIQASGTTALGPERSLTGLWYLGWGVESDQTGTTIFRPARHRYECRELPRSPRLCRTVP